MRVRDLMTREVVAVNMDTPVSAALGLLSSHGIAALPVIADGRLVGMVSEADLLRHEMPHGPGDRPDQAADAADMTYADVGAGSGGEVVADVMTTPAVAVSESTDTSDVATLMLDYEVRSVPVLKRDRVTGIVSRRDLLRMMVQDDRRIAEEIRRRLRDYSGESDRWEVEVSNGEATATGEFDEANEVRVVELLIRTVPGVRTVRTVDTDSDSERGTRRGLRSDRRSDSRIG